MKLLSNRFAALVALLPVIFGCQPASQQTATESVSQPLSMSFNWFEYQGKDEIFAEPLAQGEFQNPIAAGFYPDPTITRKGDDYYMAHSSFSYAPGVPILHSRDLVNWELIAHVLTRPEQMKFDGLGMSRGIFAPTLRYHDGLFYMITTAVDAGGNFIVTASDPAGPWSDPIWLPEIGGIDPDIFFDDDGKVYIAHNDAPDGEPLYEGHRAIRLWEYDLANHQVITGGNSGKVIVNGGVNIDEKPVWIEGPHIYKVNGWYYLTCAEGGTSVNHSQVVFRTKSLDEPFVPYAGNPILTQRDLDPARANPITSTGHADFIQTPAGDWWSVFLAVRPYQDNFYNTGRETFLLPLSWQNDWPVILPAGEAVPYRLQKPQLPEQASLTATPDPVSGNFTWRDDFTSEHMSLHWNFLRGFERNWLSVADGKLTMQPQAHDLRELQQSAFVGRRQQHTRFSASTSLILPAQEGVSGGLTAFQNSAFHYYFALQKQQNAYRVTVEQVQQGKTTVLAENTIDAPAGEALTLSIEGDKGQISFAYSLADSAPITVLNNADARMLSTETAGGFVGAMLGLHVRAESHGQLNQEN